MTPASVDTSRAAASRADRTIHKAAATTETADAVSARLLGCSASTTSITDCRLTS